MANPIKITIPPTLTSKGSFNFGQAVTFILADVLARYYRAKGHQVDFISQSWNNFAKKLEDRFMDLEGYDAYMLKAQELQNELSSGLELLCLQDSTGRFADCDSRVQQATRDSLDLLMQKGFAYIGNDSIFLDISEIVSNTRVREFIENADFLPWEMAKKRVLNALVVLDDFPLTQKAVFASEVSEGLRPYLGENTMIKPILNLMLSSRVNSDLPADFTVHGQSSLIRWVVNGFLIHAALYGQPFATRVLTYQHIELGDKSDISALFKDYSSDIIRYAALQYAERKQPSGLDMGFFEKGRKLIYRIGNLLKYYNQHEIPFANSEVLPEVEEFLIKGELTKSLNTYEKRVYELSRFIYERCEGANIEQNRPLLTEKFSHMPYTGAIFFPIISNKIFS